MDASGQTLAIGSLAVPVKSKADAGAGADTAAAGGLFAGLLAATPVKAEATPAEEGAPVTAEPTQLPGLGQKPLVLLADDADATSEAATTAPASMAAPEDSLPSSSPDDLPAVTDSLTPLVAAPEMGAATAGETQAAGGPVISPVATTVPDATVIAAPPAAATPTPAPTASAVVATPAGPAAPAAVLPLPLPGPAAGETATVTASATPAVPDDREAVAGGKSQAVPGTPVPPAPAITPIRTPAVAATILASLGTPAAEGAEEASTGGLGSGDGSDEKREQMPDADAANPAAAAPQAGHPYPIPSLSFARLGADLSAMVSRTADAAAGDTGTDAGDPGMAAARPAGFAGLAADAVARLEASLAATGSAAGRSGERVAAVRAQVLEQVVGSLTNGRGEQKLSIQLHPENLGQVDAEFIADHDRLSVVLRASSPEAELALRTHTRELTDSIVDRAARFQHVDIRIELRDGADPRGSRPDDRSPDQKQEGRQDGRRDSRGDNPGRRSDGQEAARAAWVRAWTDLSQEV